MYLLDIEKRNNFKDLLWCQGEERGVPSTGFADVRNFIYTQMGRLRLRAGFKKLNSTSLGNAVVGVAQVPWQVSTTKVVCAEGTDINVWDESTLAFLPIWTSQTTGKKTSFAAYGGNLLFANGEDPMRYWNGSICQEVIPPVGGWYAGKNPDFVVIWKDRAWCVVGPMLYASDLQVPYDFLNGTATQFPTGDDNPIKTLVDAFDKLFVVKDKSVGYVNETLTWLQGIASYTWNYTRAYSSIFGTPSAFGATSFGESIYYGSPDGTFEITGSGREGIGNYNTKRLELLGISNLFDPASHRHLNFNSFENLIVVPHLGRNEVWFFVGQDSSSIDSILVYSRALERWTRFTVPACRSACVYVTGAYQRTVAIGTDDGYVAIADQSFDGKDLGTDYVGNSYIDFIWAGKDIGELCKNWRMMTPVVQGAAFKYSTVFDGARPGVTNVPVSVGLDSLAHEVPLELDGRGFWARTRISGMPGCWPLEIEALITGSKVIRQRRFDDVTLSGNWSLVSPTNFAKKLYPIASWARSAQMDWVYAVNENVKLQGTAYNNTFLVQSNQVQVLWPEVGAGYVKIITGIWLKTELFEWEGYWANPVNPAATNYYTGGSFTNNEAMLYTTINLGTGLANGTEVEVRYLYVRPEDKVQPYQALNDYPCIQEADRGAEFTYDWAIDMLLELIGLQWFDWKARAVDELAMKTAMKFLWSEFERTHINKDPYPMLDTFDWDKATGRKLVIFEGQNDEDKVTLTTSTGVVSGTKNGLITGMAFLQDSGECWVGYGLGWGFVNFDDLKALTFKLYELTANVAMRVDICDALPDVTDYSGSLYTYSAGFRCPDALPAHMEINFDQFWRDDNVVWDGVRRLDRPGAYFTPGSPYTFNGSLYYETEDVMTPEGDKIPACVVMALNDSADIIEIGVWFGVPSGTSSSAGFAGVSCMAWVDSVFYVGLTLKMKVTGADDVERYANVTVYATGWNRFSALWGEFSGGITHPIKTVTLAVYAGASKATYKFTDICWCGADKVPVRYRYTTSGNKFLRYFQFRQKWVSKSSQTAWQQYQTAQNVSLKLSDIGFRLLIPDSYPLAPNFATSINQLGIHNWKGPTLVHYCRPHTAKVVNDIDTDGEFKTSTSLVSQRKFILDAASRYKDLYNIDGPVMPCHSRNYPENISVLEAVNNFEWWRKWRTYRLEAGAWNFNGTLADSSGWGRTFSWSGTGPTYAAGLCFPVGNSAISLSGVGYAYRASDADLVPGSKGFTVTLVLKGTTQGSDNRYIADKYSTNGWIVQTKTAGSQDIQLKLTTSAGTYYADIAGVLDNNWHSVQWSVNPITGKIRARKDGAFMSETSWTVGTGITNTANLNIGYSATVIIDLFKYDRRAVADAEFTSFWPMINGTENGSSYPEIGAHFPQYLAFRNMAMYRWMSGDTSVDTYLANFVTWVDTWGKVDGSGWKLPHWFHAYGMSYGTSYFDPSTHGIVLQGLVYHYWVTGSATALTWIGRLMDDLRLNRLDGGTGTYKTDFAYSWLFAHTLSGFGLAIYERAGATIAHHITVSANNIAFWQNRMTWLMAHTGETKPNQLSTELIPYTYYDDADSFGYAPNYMFDRNMGSTEALVLMANIAFDYAQQTGNWTWLSTLLNFLVKVTE